METRHKITAGAMIAAIALATPVIMKFEGDGNRIGYRDVVGVVTACYGHTGAGVVVGKYYTKQECQTFLAKDVQQHADGIAQCISVDVPVPSLAAFTSFSYNVGVAGFCKSNVARKLNAGDLRGACAGLSNWVYAGGRKIDGLAKRRAQERALCERGLTKTQALSQARASTQHHTLRLPDTLAAWPGHQGAVA